jgi:adenylate cyclase class 2
VGELLDYLEIEIKIKIDRIKDISKQLEFLKFHLSDEEYFEFNIVFDTPDHQLRKTGSLLRLRQKNETSILTLKKSIFKGQTNSEYKIREEIECGVLNFENIKKILFSLGYEIYFIYEKYRAIYRKDNIIVTIDRTPIGDFIEIEGEKESIDEVARSLGYEKKDYIIDSYYKLFRKQNPTGHMVFK